MERASRRSAALNSSSTSDAAAASNSSSSSSSMTSLRRRRRDASGLTAKPSTTSASQSDDGAETDASSVATPDTGSTTRSSSKKLLPLRDAKKRGTQQQSREENPATSERDTQRSSRERDGDDNEEDGDDEHDDDDEHDVSSSESHGAAAAGGGDSSSNGAKRERSLSNVSTTSSSSSVASEHDAEDQLALQQEKLTELERKKKMVEDGTLAEYCRRVSEFKEERNRLLETAEWHRSLQLKNCQDLYGFEVQRAHNLWQQAKDAVKSEMLQRVDALVLKLQQELQELTAAAEREDAAAAASSDESSALPSDATEPEDNASESSERLKTKAPSASKRRKIGSQQLLPEPAVRLPLDDISADLVSILDERTQRAQVSAARLHPKVVVNVKTERRRLHCGPYILEDGDEVVVSSPVLQEDYIGTISSVVDDAVYVKLTTGQKVRVYLELLAHRRCELKPFLRGSAGVSAVQTTGWAECEPF